MSDFVASNTEYMEALYVYLSEYHSGKRVSHKRVLELSYEDVKSAKNGLIVITPDFDNSVVSSLWISEFVSQLSVFSRRISFQLVKKPAEIKLVIISDNLRNLIDGISCCFK